jgi:uncharacterized protein (TIRG00374 family)
LTGGPSRTVWLRAAVSILCLVYLGARYGSDSAFWGILLGLNPLGFLLALAILCLGLLLSALRWRILLAAAGVSVSLGRALHLYVLGYFFNFFLPTTVGGDIVRAVGFGRGTPLSVLGGSILVERLLGFGCLLAIGIAASFSLASLQVVRQALLLAAGLFVAGVLLLVLMPLPEVSRPGRVARILAGLRRTALEVRGYGFHSRALALGLLLSFGWQLSLVGVHVVLSYGLGVVAPVKSLLALVPVTQAVTMIPVSLGGLGIREMGYEFFFRTAGYDASAGVALGVAWLGVSIVLALAGGALHLVTPLRREET